MPLISPPGEGEKVFGHQVRKFQLVELATSRGKVKKPTSCWIWQQGYNPINTISNRGNPLYTVITPLSLRRQAIRGGGSRFRYFLNIDYVLKLLLFRANVYFLRRPFFIIRMGLFYILASCKLSQQTDFLCINCLVKQIETISFLC